MKTKNFFAIALLLVVAISLVIVGCVTPPTNPTPTPSVSPNSTGQISSKGTDLLSFKSWDDVGSFLEASGAKGGYYGISETLGAPMMAKASDSSSGGSGGRDYSTTNVQVAGVDEADILKNDGTFLYVVSDGSVKILNAFPASGMKLVSEIPLGGKNGRANEIFVYGDKLVVFGYENAPWEPRPMPAVRVGPLELVDKAAKALGDISVGLGVRCLECGPYYQQASFVKVYDITDRSKPSLVKNFEVSGGYVQSRLIDGRVYVVSSESAYSGGPIPLYAKDGVVRETRPVDINYVDYPDRSYSFTTVLGFNLNDLTEQESRKVVLMGYAQTLFVSAKNAYVTQTMYDYAPVPAVGWADYEKILEPYATQDFKDKITAITSSDLADWRKEGLKVSQAQAFISGLDEKVQTEIYDKINAANQNLQDQQAKSMMPYRYNSNVYTVIHKFALGKSISYEGKGQVPGSVLNQFSMDEDNGYFRIATTIDHYNYGPQDRFQQNTPENAVYVLDGKLKIVGSVANLAPGERIYSARFMGDKLYLVTFKQVDPLFIIDLKDPAKPAVLGYLKIPGYSSYLHPFDETHVIGLGKNTQDIKEGSGNFAFPLGVKLSLFDVSEVSTPKEVASYDIGDAGSDSAALNDHKAFLFNPKTGLLVIPVLEAKVDKSKYPNGIPDHVYGDFVFQGAYAFTVSLDKGFQLKGTVSHATPDELGKAGYYYYGTQVQRSAYIDDVLYTLSNRFVKANDLGTLAPLASVEISNGSQYYPGGMMR